MKAYSLSINNWDQLYYAVSDDLSLKNGDQVVFRIDNGLDVGIVIDEIEVNNNDPKNPLKTIVRLANESDLKKLDEINSKRSDCLKTCRKMIQKNKLPMKLVDCHISLDTNRLVFGFIADGRVDFRNLVKDLNHRFKKNIRLQQMGIRDEARINGDIGPCGAELCCRKFLRQLESVTSDYAKIQGVEHRGCERLSGACGRLKCCLAFEADIYKELMSKMPKLGSSYRTKKGMGKVHSLNLIKQTFNVQVDQGNIIEVDLKE